MASRQASKAIYSAVAVVGIAVVVGVGVWYESRPTGPTEITAQGAAGAPANAASGAGGAAGAGAAARGPGLPGVEVAKVEVSRLQDDAQAVGSLRSKQNVMLRPEVSGRVQALGFTDGGRVRKGEVMMQLEDGLQRAEVRQADAQMSIARANLKRNQELVAQNFVAQRVLDESAANVQVVEAQLSLACARWDRMRVIAPFDGTVGIRNVNIGDYVKDGADLVNLEDLSSMYVDFRLPERFVGKVRRDQTIEMQLDALPGRQFKAKIQAIDPQLDANGRSVLIRATLPNTAGEPLAPRSGGPGAQAGSAASSGSNRVAGAGQASAGAAQGASAAPSLRAPSARDQAQRVPNRAVAASTATSAPRPADAIASICAPFAPSSAAALATASRPGAAAAGAPQSGSGAQGAARGAGGQSSHSGQGNGQGSGQGSGQGATAPLRPGMFARVTAVFNVNDAALSVPEEAIVPQGGRQFVIRLIEQTEAQAKEIADKQAADAAKAANAARAGAPAGGSAGGVGGAGGAGGASGAGGGAAGAQPYFMGGFVDGKRLVSQRVEVRLGIRRPGKVEILDGLSEADTVVVAGQQRLQRDNTPVRVIELGRSAGAASGAGAAASGAATATTAAAPSLSATGSVGTASAPPASAPPVRP